MAESSPKGQKTLWEKVKLLVTSNFTFSHSVFKRLVMQTRKNQGLFGKGLRAKRSGTQLHNFSFQSHRLLFSHASAEGRGENTLERKFASTGDQTHNHRAMSLTHSPLSHQGGAKTSWKKKRILVTSTFAFFHNVFKRSLSFRSLK